MDLEDVVKNQLGCLFSRRELGKGHKINRLGEAIYHRENNGCNPLKGEKPETKSKAICDQGQEGMGRGRSRPTEGWLETLFWAQTEQDNTNCLTSWPMEGHQNR